MQQNVRVNVTNRGCGSSLLGIFALLIVLALVVSGIGKVFRFLTSGPGIALIGIVVIAAALYFSRRRNA